MLHVCLLFLFFFFQSLSKVFRSSPEDSKRNPPRNSISKGLLVAGELSSVSVIEDATLYVKGENSEGLHPRATHPATNQVFNLKQVPKTVYPSVSTSVKWRSRKLNNHLASGPLKIPRLWGTASANTGKDIKKACTKSCLFPEELLKIFTVAFLGGVKDRSHLSFPSHSSISESQIWSFTIMPLEGIWAMEFMQKKIYSSVRVHKKLKGVKQNFSKASFQIMSSLQQLILASITCICQYM